MKIEKGIYQHYKGPLYEVYDVVFHSETEEALVLYKPLYEDAVGTARLWVRPYAMFVEDVEVTGTLVPRFKKIETDTNESQ